MTENEKRLRESLGPSMLHHLEMLLAEMTEEKRVARAEALEEAAQTADGGPLLVRGVLMQPSERIRALITTPAPDSIPVERVREVLRDECDASRSASARLRLRQAARHLGVPLDAEQEATTEQVIHLRREAQWAACGAAGSGPRLSSNPADVTCEDSRCKVTP